MWERKCSWIFAECKLSHYDQDDKTLNFSSTVQLMDDRQSTWCLNSLSLQISIVICGRWILNFKNFTIHIAHYGQYTQSLVHFEIIHSILCYIVAPWNMKFHCLKTQIPPLARICHPSFITSLSLFHAGFNNKSYNFATFESEQNTLNEYVQTEPIIS
jgi:hypothetical protein